MKKIKPNPITPANAGWNIDYEGATIYMIAEGTWKSFYSAKTELVNYWLAKRNEAVKNLAEIEKLNFLSEEVTG
jgi:hypothetical protein